MLKAIVFCLCDEVLVSGQPAGVNSVRGCQKLLPCHVESVPASSKEDVLLAKAEPNSSGGSASGITLNKWKEVTIQEQLQPERGVRKHERSIPADLRVSAEGGAGGSPGARAVISLLPMVRQLCPLLPMEVHSGAEILLQPVEKSMLKQVEGAEGICDPVGSPCTYMHVIVTQSNTIRPPKH